MDQAKSDFANFSEGLSKLKLKKNTKKQEGIINQNNQPKITETSTTVQGNFSELEKLLMQLKNTNTNIKEELGANIKVNNNFNINFNNNINIQASQPSTLNIKQDEVKKNQKNEISIEEVKIDDIPEAEENSAINRNEENEKNNNFGFSPIEKINISDIKGNNTTVAKNDDQEEYNDIKKFIANNQDKEEENNIKNENKLAIVNDIFDDSFDEIKNQKDLQEKTEIQYNKENQDNVKKETEVLNKKENQDNVKKETEVLNKKENQDNVKKETELKLPNDNKKKNEFEIKELLDLKDIDPNDKVNNKEIEESLSNNKGTNNKDNPTKNSTNKELNRLSITESLLDPKNIQNEIAEMTSNKELGQTELIELDVEDIEIKEVGEMLPKDAREKDLLEQKEESQSIQEIEEIQDDKEKMYNYNNVSKSSNKILKKSFTFKNDKDKENLKVKEDSNVINSSSYYANMNNTNNLSTAKPNLIKNSFAENLEKIETSLPVADAKNYTSDSLLNKSKIENEILNSTNQINNAIIIPAEKYPASSKSMLTEKVNNFEPSKKEITGSNRHEENEVNEINNQIGIEMAPQNMIMNESNIVANNDPARESLIFDPKEILEFNEQDSKYLDRKASHKEGHFMKVDSDTLLHHLNTRNSNLREIEKDLYFNRENDHEIEQENSFSLKNQKVDFHNENNIKEEKEQEKLKENNNEIQNKIQLEEENKVENVKSTVKSTVKENSNNTSNNTSNNFFTNKPNDSSNKINTQTPNNKPSSNSNNLLENEKEKNKKDNENKTPIQIEKDNKLNNEINPLINQDNDFVFEDAVDIEEAPILSNNKVDNNVVKKEVKSSPLKEKEVEISNNKSNNQTKQNEHINTMDAFFGGKSNSDNLNHSSLNDEHIQLVKSTNKNLEKEEKTHSSISPISLNKEKETLLNKENYDSFNPNEELIKRKLKNIEEKEKLEINTEKEVNLNLKKEEKLKNPKEKEKEIFISNNHSVNNNEHNNNNNNNINNYNSNNIFLTTEENIPLNSSKIKSEDVSILIDSKDIKKLIIFEKEEVHYNETVTDFSSIFKEKNYMFLKRRASLMSNEYYREYILKEFNIVDKHKKLPHSYPDILEEGLNSFLRESDFHSIFQDVIGDDNNNKAEMLKLLEETRVKNSSLFLVGKLKPILNFVEKYNLNVDHEIEEITKKEISAFREIKCDGDSFYRAFMFGLFEYYILHQNIHEIKKLVLDIYRINKNPRATIFKSRNIDFNKALVIFYLIIEHILNNNTERAYDTFIRAYMLEDNSFDLILIGYMRLILWLNVAELEKQANKIKKQMTKSLTNNATKTIPTKEFEEVNIDTFLVYQNEPCKLAMSLIPLVFNANVDLYVYDGSIHKGKSNIFYTKQKFSLNALDNLPVISVSYNLSSYSKFYPVPFYQKFKNIFRNYVDSAKISRSFVPAREELCEKCNVKNVMLVFVQHNLSICKECLKKSISVTMEKRSVIFNKENFINRECKLNY
jgi:hypothetical protein